MSESETIKYPSSSEMETISESETISAPLDLQPIKDALAAATPGTWVAHEHQEIDRLRSETLEFIRLLAGHAGQAKHAEAWQQRPALAHIWTRDTVDELERLRGFARAVIGDPDVDLAELDAEMGAKVLEQWTLDWDDAGKAEVLKDQLAKAVALLKKWEAEIQPHPTSIVGQAFRALLKYERKE